MLFLTLALASALPTCTDIRQQCRACPTGGNVGACSTVGIACQPTRRICVPAKTPARPDRTTDKKAR